MLALLLAAIGCKSGAGGGGGGGMDLATNGPQDFGTGFCSLPGSVRQTAGGAVTVPGGVAHDLGFLHLPDGFCAHYFGNVGNARQLRFAPGGELFVASPTTGTTGGGAGGQSAIIVMPDDNHDGYADASLTYLGSLPSTQGLLFAGGYLYYQDDKNIMRVPYNSGDRAPSGASVVFATIAVYFSPLHWPKTLDIADDGATIYVGNGGDQNEVCDSSRPFRGGILKLDASAAPGSAPVQVAKGFRNPIAIRCQHGHGQCYAVELAMDFSGDQGGREKVVPIHQGDDWGHPCCLTKNIAFPGWNPTPDCSMITPDTSAFIIGETPFGIDFESGKWPAPWTNDMFAVLHGQYSSWKGARLVGIPTNGTTGAPLPSSDLNGTPTNINDFATGWDDRTNGHGRPAAIIFAPDGRLFLANDNNGDIIWMAPLSL
jgi:glucose/arabinose dehydrogenase